MRKATAISELELGLACKLQRVSYPPGSSHKRFVYRLGARTLLTEGGRWYMAFVARRYRRQIKLSEAEALWIHERLAREPQVEYAAPPAILPSKVAIAPNAMDQERNFKLFED